MYTIGGLTKQNRLFESIPPFEALRLICFPCEIQYLFFTLDKHELMIQHTRVAKELEVVKKLGRGKSQQNEGLVLQATDTFINIMSRSLREPPVFLS